MLPQTPAGVGWQAGRMRYVIYGAGAIGGTLAGRLFEGGCDVVVIARGEHLAAIRRDGLTLSDPDRSVTLPVPAVAHPAEAELTDDDVVVLATKSQDTAGALADLRPTAPDGVRIACAQNGVENERLALRVTPAVYGVTVMLPAEHWEPGLVWCMSSPVSGMLDIGRYPSGTDATSDQMAEDFGRCTFDTRSLPDVLRWKYAKLRMNLYNAVQAICGLDADTADLFRNLLAEAVACYEAAGIDAASHDEDKERRGDRLQIRPVGDHGRGGGSSWQSLHRHAGTIETDYLNGEIVLLGRLFGVPTPVNAGVQRIADRLAATGAGPGTMTAAELRSEIDAG